MAEGASGLAVAQLVEAPRWHGNGIVGGSVQQAAEAGAVAVATAVAFRGAE